MFLRQIKLLVKSLIFLILTLNFSYSEVVKKLKLLEMKEFQMKLS